MNISFNTKTKAGECSSSHFNSRLSDSQMLAIAKHVAESPTEIGVSDRANPGYVPTTLLWSVIAGHTIQLTLDTMSYNKGEYVIITMYPVRNVEYRRQRFNMKKI